MHMHSHEKYNKMHTDILQLCMQNEIRIMPGKVVSHELLENRNINSLKDFFLFSEDMDLFHETCVSTLERHGYEVKRVKGKSGRFCRIFQPDAFASSIVKLMKNTDVRHCPQIIIRELIESDNDYILSANGKQFHIEQASLNRLEKVDYRGCNVYAYSDMEAYLQWIYGNDYKLSSTFTEYVLFDTGCSEELFMTEAKKRGYLSEERIARYDERKLWRREYRAEYDQKYRDYVKNLLALNQESQE